MNRIDLFFDLSEEALAKSEAIGVVENIRTDIDFADYYSASHFDKLPTSPRLRRTGRMSGLGPGFELNDTMPRILKFIPTPLISTLLGELR